MSCDAIQKLTHTRTAAQDVDNERSDAPDLNPAVTVADSLPTVLLSLRGGRYW